NHSLNLNDIDPSDFAVKALSHIRVTLLDNKLTIANSQH
ncbi:MAG: hypothetical protein ACJAW8_002723, partial [Oleispira sp.]